MGRVRRLAAQVARGAGRVLLVAALLLVVAAASLLLPGVRGGLLGLAVRVADRTLPGRLAADGHHWPAPGRLEFANILWLADDDGEGSPPDTLAHVRRLGIAMDLDRLRGHDLVADSLVVDVAFLDLPQVAALFVPADSAAARPAAGGAAPAGFLRPGSIPGLPSAAVRRCVVDLHAATVAPGWRVSGLHLAADADLLAGSEPSLLVRSARGRVANDGDALSIDVTALGLGARYLSTRREVVVDTLTLDVASAGPADLVARWRACAIGPLAVRGQGRARLDADGGEAAVRCDLRLPGAPLLGAAWPANLDPAGFADLDLGLDLQGTWSSARITAAGAVELRPLPEVRRLRLRGAADFAPAEPGSGRYTLESLELAVAGLDLQAQGRFAAGRLEVGASAAVQTPVPLLEAFVPEASVVSLQAHLKATAEGAPASPRFIASVQGDAAYRSWAVGNLDLGVAGGLERLDVGLDTGPVVQADRTLADALHGRITLADASGADLRVTRRLDASVLLALVGGPRQVHGRVQGRALLDPRDPLAGAVQVDTLDLAAPGLALQASGHGDSATVDVQAKVALASPCELVELFVPALVDATYALDADLQAAGPIRDPRGRVAVTASLESALGVVPQLSFSAAGSRRDAIAHLDAGGGLVWGGQALADSLVVDAALDADAADGLPLRAGVWARRGRLAAGVLAQAGFDSVAVLRLDTLGLDLGGQFLTLRKPATVRVDTAARRLAWEPLDLAGSAGTIALVGELSPQRTRFSAAVDLILTEAMLQETAPSELWSRDGGLDLALQGDLGLAVAADTTGFSGGVQVRLRPHRDATDLGARLVFHLDEGERPGLGADFTVTAADTALLGGALLWPGRFDRDERRWVTGHHDELEISVPEQTLVTGLLRRVLPPDVRLRGDLTFGAAAALPLGPPDSTRTGSVAGVLRTPRLHLDLPGSSRLEVRADCRVEGTPADPRLVGRVTVPSGFIRIPELPRNLHPVEGSPALWSMAADDTLADPEVAAATAAWGADEQRAAPPYLPDLDLNVSVPGNLRIHGYGLDVEVAAEVNVRRGVDARGAPGPALRGEAHAVRGTLRFMNRNFDIKRAEVTFTGTVPPDPRLDFELQTAISGTVIRLNVTGTATAPVIDLGSDPDMNRADIVAYLLFGRPLNDLDPEQKGRSQDEKDPSQQLRENLAGLALVFGTAGLQNSVSGTLGVDIVEVGSDANGGSTLSAGKYIGPKVLLKYSTSLEKAGTYFLTMEYAISEMFRLVTTYGEGDETSGLELKWIRRY